MSNKAIHYYFTVRDLAQARGEIAELAFDGLSPETFALALQAALREPTLWQRWRDLQPDPEAIDPASGLVDPSALVVAHQADLHTDLEVTTVLPHSIIKHRLTLLVGHAWKLHDVRAK